MLPSSTVSSSFDNDSWLAALHTALLDAAPNGGRLTRGVGSTLGVATHPGMTRERNEDRVIGATWATRHGTQFWIFAVADGVGGMSRGADCAAWALAALVRATWAATWPSGVLETTVVRSLLHSVNASASRKYSGNAGTTLTALLAEMQGGRARFRVLHAGDSRAYLVTAGRGCTQLTTDDTLAGMAASDNSAGGPPSPAKHRLLQYVGMSDDFDPHCDELAAQPALEHGSRFILATDGVFRSLAPDVIQALSTRASTPVQCAERLVTSALWLDGGDNASALVVDPSTLHSAAVRTDEIVRVWHPASSLVLPIPEWTSRLARESEMSPNPEHYGDTSSLPYDEAEATPRSRNKPRRARKSKKRTNAPSTIVEVDDDDATH